MIQPPRAPRTMPHNNATHSCSISSLIRPKTWPAESIICAKLWHYWYPIFDFLQWDCTWTGIDLEGVYDERMSDSLGYGTFETSPSIDAEEKRSIMLECFALIAQTIFVVSPYLSWPKLRIDLWFDGGTISSSSMLKSQLCLSTARRLSQGHWVVIIVNQL